MIWKVSSLSTKTNLKSCCCFTSSFRGATRTSLSLHSNLGSRSGSTSHTPHHVLAHARAVSPVWMMHSVSLGFAPACYGRKHRRVRCSVSCIEVMHLKEQSSALSGPAKSSTHFGFHVQTAAQHELPFVHACTELVFDLDAMLIHLEPFKLLQLAFIPQVRHDVQLPHLLSEALPAPPRARHHCTA